MNHMMKTNSSGKGIAVLLMVLFMTSVGALAGNMSWVFQDTMQSMGSELALSMRGGSTWPVIFGDGDMTMLLPTGWTPQTAILPGGGMCTQSASSPTGAVAVISDGYGVVSTQTGWSSISAHAIAYDGQGRLWKATLDGTVAYMDSHGWNTVGTNIFNGMTAQTVAIAVNSMGEIGVAASMGDLKYFQYTPVLGQWMESEPDAFSSGPGGPNGAQVSLVFDAHDRPHIAYSDGDGLVWDNDIKTGQWTARYLPGAFGVGQYLPLAFNGDDTIATAYVNGSGDLTYVYSAGDGVWSTAALPLGAGGSPGSADFGSVGLAYDYEGIPVIAFSAGGSAWLAYDPPSEAPEPATMGLMIVGGGLALLRRRK